MIRNERTYKITRAAAEKFRHSITEAKAAGAPTDVHPKLHAASIGGMEHQLHDLERELKAYDQLKNAKGKKRFDGHFADLSTLLVSARIARGLTQRQLGERLGLHMQKIQQYEAGGYANASLTRIQEIAQALGADVQVSVKLIEFPTGIETMVRDAAERQPTRRAKSGAK